MGLCYCPRQSTSHIRLHRHWFQAVCGAFEKFWGEVWHDSLSSTKIVSTSEKLRYDLNKNELDYDDMGFFQKFGYRLKNLSEGNYRLLLVGSVLLPLIVTFLKYKSNSSLYVEDFIEKFIITTLIYWILTWFALWIYEGFQENWQNGT